MNTSLKGIATNILGYTGVVTLSQYTGTKKTVLARAHNEGGTALFNYLANCLVGDFDVANMERPTKIMLLNATTDEISGQVQLIKAQNTDFIYLLTRPERVYNDAEGVVRYSFIVPQDMLTGTDFNAVGLYPASATTEGADLADYAALCKIELDRNNLALSSALVLDWELHISNSMTN